MTSTHSDQETGCAASCPDLPGRCYLLSLYFVLQSTTASHNGIMIMTGCPILCLWAPTLLASCDLPCEDTILSAQLMLKFTC